MTKESLSEEALKVVIFAAFLDDALRIAFA